ncbi:YadA-like family protein [Klebsiella grimontii]|uniref:YadA-like family protein n=6 Tax=Klebsiella grimontii TaxID=2058152 RepID=UPI001E2F04E0|nr:YadA-like family protein [Klebsiella grimontii]
MTAATVATKNVTINGTSYNFAGTAPTSTVSVGIVGSERTVTNVAAGRITASSTDAINGSQLYATNQSITALAAKPVTFAGNTGSVTKKLGETLTVKGGKTTAGTYSDKNLNTVVDTSGNLVVQMADNPVFTSAIIGGTTTLNSSGMTITGGPSVTTTGVNAGSKKVTNVAAGTLSSTSTDGVNGSQLYATNQNVATNTTNINTLKNTPLTFAGNTGTVTKKLGETLTVKGGKTTAGTYSDKNLNTVVDANGNLVVQMAENPVFTSAIIGGTTTLNSSGMTITGGPSVTTTGVNAGSKKVTNVAAGTLSSTSTDGVNGSQLYATNQNVATNTTNITNLANTPLTFAGNTGSVTKKLGETLTVKGGKTTAGTYSDKNLNTVVDANGNLVVQMAENPVFTSAIIGGTTTLNSSGLTITGGPSVTTTGVNAGSKKVTNVAAGTLSSTSTDGVNGSQLYATNQNVATNTTNITNLANTPLTFAGNTGSVTKKLGETLTVKGGKTTAGTYSDKNLNTVVDANGNLVVQMAENPVFTSAIIGGTTTLNNSGLTITGGPSVTTTGVNAGSKKVTNVAAGTLSSTSTDGVNGSQLYATNSNINNIYNTGIKYFHANSTGEDSQATGLDSVAIGMGAVAGFDNDIALGAGSVTAETVATKGVTLDGTDYAFAGVTPTSTVSIGSEGAERTLTNVAAGRLSETSTDAVNGSQLHATNTALNTLGDRAVQYDLHEDGSVNYGDITLGGDTYNQYTNEGGTTITNVADGSAPSDAVNFSQLTETNNSIQNLYTSGTKYFHANSTGTDSAAVGADSVAIGMGAVAAHDNSVALGAGSVTSGAVASSGVTLAGTDYVFAGSNPGSTVSVGDTGAERTITHVAAGRLSETSTDAINGSQLYATNSAVNNIFNEIDGLQDDALLWNETLNAYSASHDDTAVNKITRVADGDLNEVSTDAVNGSQLYATNQQVEGNTTSINNLGDTVENIYTTGTKYFHANSTGTDSSALGLDSVAIGMGAIAANKNDVALGAGSVSGVTVGTAGVTLGGTDYAFAGANPTSTVSVGDVGSERTVTNVAAGRLSETSTDAVNGSQLHATNTTVNNISSEMNGLKDDALQWDPSQNAYSASHGDTTVNRITNVAAGELSTDSTDAVNGSQLYATNQQVEGNTTSINNLGDTVENIYNTGTKYFHANSTGTDSSALGLDSVAIGMGAIAGNQNDVALGANSKTAATVGTAGVTLRGTDYAFAGANPTSTVSVGDVGSERTVTNVAAGRLSATSTDAVNGSQLYATNTAVENISGDVSGLQQDALQWDPSQNAYSASHGDTTVNRITNVAAGELSTDSTDAVNGSQLYATNQQVEGNTTNIAQNTQNISDLGDTVENIYTTGTKYFHANSTGTDSSALGLDSVAIGMGAIAGNQNDVALGAGSVSGVTVGTSGVTLGGTDYAFAGANPTSTVSVGDVGSERTVTNVAAGRLSATSTDAVNGSQLYATNQQVEGNTTSINNLGDSVENIYTTGTKYFHANSTGTDSSALGLDSVAIGMGAIAGNQNDVALGANSKTAATVGTAGVTLRGTDYAFAGANPTSTVSVGDVGSERTVTNVAAGRLSATSTDAVNGSQLHATNTAMENISGDVSGLQQDALQWDPSQNAYSASHGDTTVNRITNVAAGELSTDSTDAVNGSQLYATNQQVEGNTTNIAQNTQNISDLGDTVENIYTTGTKYFHANSTGTDSSALGLDSVAIGMGAIAGNQNDVALGANSKTAATVGTAGVTLRGTDYAFAGANPTSTVSVGDVGSERTVTNVAAGRLSATSTDAVNGSQLYATNTAVENISGDVSGLQQDALQWDPSQNAYSASHGDTTVNRITNVAAGELSTDSTDAVNGSQLYATNQQVEGNTTSINNLGDSVENIYTTGTKYFHANSTGTDSSALGLDSVAIGMGAIAGNQNDVALGANSKTAATVGTAGVTLRGTDYAFAGANPTSTVSVGDVGSERTVTNVAAGRLSATSTDAVNGSQLYATNTAVENISGDVSGLQQDALQWDPSQNAYSASHGDTTVNRITNVAAGELSTDSTDAVNGSQLYATNQQVEGNTTNIAQNTQNISDLGDTVENIYNTGTKYFHANSTGTDSSALGLDSVAIGMGAIAGNQNDVALGANSKTAATVGTAGVTLRGTDYAFAGANPTSTVSVGDVGSERTVTNVAAGRLSATSTDAVNGSQLHATNTAMENISGDVSGLQQDALQWDPSQNAYSASHGDTTVNRITNVAAGELSTDSTDAVNGSQLYATNQQVEGNTTNIAQNTQNISDLGDTVENIYNTGTKYFHANSTGTDSSALGLDSVAIGMGAIAGNQNDVALGANSKTAATVGTAGVTLRGTDYAFAGANPTSTVSVGDVGSERTVTNVAAGRLSATSTDAVNGSQLYATNTAVENISGDVSGLQQDALQWDPSQNAYSASHGDTTVNRITNVAAGELSTDSTDAVNGSQLYATNQQVEGNTTNIAQNTQNISDLGDTVENIYTTGTKYFHANSTGTDSSALGLDSVAIGMGAVAVHKNDVALGANSVTGATVATTGVNLGGTDYAFAGANPTSTVSVGDVGSERTVTNVAAGRLSATSTDAVNGSQLFATNQQVEGNTTNIAQNTQNISDLGDTVENIYTTGTKYFHANSTGADSQALGLDSVAIGMGAVANNAGDIALGAGSLSEAAVGTAGVSINGTDYAFAGAAPTSTLSVGSEGAERTITNVAAGRLSSTSTDAVNGSQLYATNTAVENLNVSVGGLQNDALLWDENLGAFSASHGSTTVNRITNVAAGELSDKSTDAVNGSQLYATNQNVEANTTSINNLGDTVENIYNTGTKYFHANSTGADSQALGLDSVAIGMGAVANNAGDIALGAGSLTEAAVGTAGVTLRGIDYAFAGANPTSTVSVGSEGAERTITNVAAGRLSETSTDAVNGSQLYATNTALDELHTSVGGLQNDALLWDETLGAFSAGHGNTTVNKITNVAAGVLSKDSTDAVNGSQLYATNQNVETNTASINNLGDTVENIYITGTKYFHANSTGADSQALGLDSVAIGMGAVANNAGDIALGAGSLTEAAVGTAGVSINGTDYAFAGAAPTSTLSVGSEGAERTITNVAAGRLSSTSTDAVNGSQLYATNTAVENLNVSVGGLQNDALLWDENLGAFSASHGSTTVNKITNVAAGELSDKSTDAVNGSQLYATNQKVDNLDYRVTNIEESYTNTVMPTMRYLKVNSTGPDAVASGTDAIALGQGAVASGNNSIATGNGAQASGNGAIATGNNASASGTGSVAIGDNASVTASNSVALGSGSVADRDNTVSVGSAGNERQVTNVAAGTEDTDAVNVAQLKDATGSITNNVTNISSGKDGMFQVNNTSNYAKPAVSGSDSLAGGAGSSASGSNSMAVGTKASASGANSVALGNGSSATAKNSVALGANSVASRENTVSMGTVGGERQITNVAAGTENTDAVNVGQLKQGVSESVNYTNKQFNQLKNMVNDQKDKLSAGIAGAMAMSSLPQPYSPGASMVGLGGGTYQGQSAVAFGVSTISDNGKWVTKVSGTTNSQGDFGASIGVGYQW